MKYFILHPYRYRLAESVSLKLRNRDLLEMLRRRRAVHPFFAVEGETVCASKDYAWDGATGALFQTRDLIIPSLVHDIGCQAINLELLPWEMRPAWDREYLLQCEAYKVAELRREIHYRAIRVWGLIPKKEDGLAPYAMVHEIAIAP